MTLSGTLSTPQGMSGMLSLSAGTDPTLSREGVAADAKAVGELKADIIEDTVSGPIANITDARAGAVNSLEVAITPKQAGSGDPSPTNIRTISGWTEAKITKTGKNLLPKSTLSQTTNGVALSADADGVITMNGTASAAANVWVNGTKADSLFYLPAGTYRYSDNATGTFPSNNSNRSQLMTEADTAVTAIQNNAAGTAVSTFTLTQGTYVYVRIRLNGSSAYSGCKLSPMITAVPAGAGFEPYAATIYSVSFGDAGTVYEGRLNVTTGELTVTHGYIASYSGQSLPGKWISDKAVYAAGTTPPTGAQVVYELATPVTYQLTPTEIIALLGDNNIWADCGNVGVEYKCDTKKYIQKLTMPTEDDMTANANIASGKYFMVGNNLYYSTASIANGAQIIVGTNCNRVSLAEALNNINS